MNNKKKKSKAQTFTPPELSRAIRVACRTVRSSGGQLSGRRRWFALKYQINVELAQHMSRQDLNELTDTPLTTCTGRLFHALTTRIENNFSLRVVEHLFFFSV